MKDTILDILDTLVTLILISIFISGIVFVSIADKEEKKKKDCYEIYATDKIILKRCEKYIADVVDTSPQGR